MHLRKPAQLANEPFAADGTELPYDCFSSLASYRKWMVPTSIFLFCRAGDGK